MSHPVRPTLNLGFIPLVDCAPLAVARELGLFAVQGLSVTLSREASWANIRDKVQAGVLDGAHMLAPMPIAATLGAGGERAPMIAPLSLNTGGSAITLSSDLAAQMREADPEGMAARPRTAGPLARVVQARQARGERPLTLAAVFPYSMHAYALRYWLAEAGVDPDRDVRLVITPPPRMAARLKAGEIDGFCVGAPWSAMSEADGAGETLIDAWEFWPGGPDKVFAVTSAWAERNTDMLDALIRALIAAAIWADTPGNHDELAAMLAGPAYVDAPAPLIRRSLTSGPDGVAFHRGAAGIPRRRDAVWFGTQMMRWGQIDSETDLQAVANSVYRPDIYRAAAALLGAPAPPTDDGSDGLRVDRFFDGRIFDPADPLEYVRSFRVGRDRADVGSGD